MRGRFAPSPTGRLHLGNARSALLGWLWARSVGGKFLLRVEDLDPARSRPEYVKALFDDLTYLGLDWDGPVLFQSKRSRHYQAALDHLQAQGQLYPCFCSRADIARVASAPHGPGDDGPRYPGTCAHLSPTERAQKLKEGKKPALRFRVPPGEAHFTDAIQGPWAQDVAQAVGDFVVQRADGVASYQLAVVVDDAESGITHVLRGDDLHGSTPRQLALYRALGHCPPVFAHVPLVMGSDGRRLAKREGAFALSELRARGVPAERVVGLLAAWSGLGDGSPVSAQTLAGRFGLEQVPQTPVVAHELDVRRALGLASDVRADEQAGTDGGSPADGAPPALR